MRHRVHGRKLGRTTAHRKALFRNQLTALFTHERIVTTVAKAKELRPLAERMVTLARTGSLLGMCGKCTCTGNCEKQSTYRKPDMLILGKALSGGMYPVSAVLADPAIPHCLT